jgi:transcription initiation factor TFIIIB Brf1 subunit/transcription initiation factor TFIIB
MSTSAEHKLKCPYCGGNPVVYDPQFSEYICPHCGAVLEDHPILDVAEEPRSSDKYKHIGSYILNPNYKRLILRQIHTVYMAERRKIRLAVNLLHDMCVALSVPESACLSAEWRLLSVIDRLRDKLVSRPKVVRLLRVLAALSLYVSSRELGYAVALEDVARLLGVSAGKLYTLLWQYRDIVGYKYTDVTELYLPRVLRALSKQLTPEQLERVAKLTRELLEKYPILSGKPLHRTLAYAIVAARLSGVEVLVGELARELGVSEGIYSKATRLQRVVKRLEALVKK